MRDSWDRLLPVVKKIDSHGSPDDLALRGGTGGSSAYPPKVNGLYVLTALGVMILILMFSTNSL